MTDYCKYVNVFHGCEEIAPKPPRGIAAKWFFIKAGCGNTSPAATVPFGAVSVGPYSGGYPTGYLDHRMNSHSRPPRFPEGKKLLGFAHLQQSGTGAIGYYYNYALVTPRYNGSPARRSPENEVGEPGYYAVTLEDIRCELTTDGRCAFHRYTFGHGQGYITIDFSNNGLRIPGIERAAVRDLVIKQDRNNRILASAVLEGVNVYFRAEANVALTVRDGLVCSEKTNGPILLRVSISPRSAENAASHLSGNDFDAVRRNAYGRWNEILSRIAVEGEPEKMRIFYSNLYHSLVKPADWTGDSFLYSHSEAFAADLNTLWDMYKTEMPLLFLLDGDITDKTCETLLCLGETLGYLPNAVGLTTDCLNSENQARMLAEYVLYTALTYGHTLDIDRVLRVVEKDVYHESKADFVHTGRCRSNTFILDMADGCALTAQLAARIGDAEAAKRFAALGEKWKNAYDKKTGLLRDDGEYYEGTLYNYSFRQMFDMDARISLAGGKSEFVRLLDAFFGYGAEDVVQPTDPDNYAPVAAGMRLGRFEGFNNESDTEAPFSYIYADRHDRTCEIIRGGMEYMFTEGPGGLPGNNDTGALSSYYVLCALGLFPVAGQNLFLLGSPLVDSATFRLYNGNVLHIAVENQGRENIYVDEIRFNDTPVHGFRLTADQIIGGGTLYFRMTATPHAKS